MYFEAKMSKVQTGQIIEFYSNTCKVLVTNKEYKCQIQGRIDLVVGDLVEIEQKEELDNSQAVVIRRLKRNTALFKAKETAWSVVDLSVYDVLTISAAAFAYPTCLTTAGLVVLVDTIAQLVAINNEVDKRRQHHL